MADHRADHRAVHGVERFPRWAPLVTLPLTLAGLALSVYLTWVHYVAPTSLSCPDTGVVNCTKVTTSAASMLFGRVPVALAGALFFLGMAALSLPVAWRSASRLLRRARLTGAVAGMAMVCYLVYVEAVVVRAVCLYCTAVHGVAFALFVAVLATAVPAVEDDPDDPDDLDDPDGVRPGA